jgi:hypothetical protein
MTSPPRAILSPNGVAESIFSQALSGHPLGGGVTDLNAENRREAVAVAVAVMPFTILAIIGAIFDVRILAIALILLVPVALVLAWHAFLFVRFRHLKPSDVPHQIDIPNRLVLTRAALPFTTLVILFSLAFVAGRSSDGLSSRALAVSAAAAFACWAIINWLWRRWARSLGFEPDAVLASIHRSKAYPELVEAARRREAEAARRLTRRCS